MVDGYTRSVSGKQGGCWCKSSGILLIYLSIIIFSLVLCVVLDKSGDGGEEQEYETKRGEKEEEI